MANSYWSDFNGTFERSWQAGYGIDFATFGVPGLTYNIAYVRAVPTSTTVPTVRGTEREI